MGLGNPSLVRDGDLNNRVSGFVNGRDLQWKDISKQRRRTYIFRNGQTTVNNPVRLHEKQSDQGFSHRIVDGSDDAHYIPSGWLSFSYDTAQDIHLRSSEWQDISDELWRTYHFNDCEIIVSGPSRLLVDRTQFGDMHTVVDEDGMTHVIAAGWLRLSWTVRNKENPVNFG